MAAENQMQLSLNTVSRDSVPWVLIKPIMHALCERTPDFHPTDTFWHYNARFQVRLLWGRARQETQHRNKGVFKLQPFSINELARNLLSACVFQPKIYFMQNQNVSCPFCWYFFPFATSKQNVSFWVSSTLTWVSCWCFLGVIMWVPHAPILSHFLAMLHQI